MQEQPEQSIRIGDLLIRSGVVSPENLESALALSTKMRVPLGRVLDMHGYLSEYALACAIQIQSMIADRQVSMEGGIKALESVVRQDIDLETAIRQINRNTPRAVPENTITNRLGELLNAAGLITPAQLKQGLYNSLNTGLPLGMVLVQMNALSEDLLQAGLTAQRMIRDGALTRDEGLQALRAARLRSTSFEQSLIDHHFDASQVRTPFGAPELLVHGGIMTDKQLIAARELELLQESSLDSVLVECGLVSEVILSASQQLIAMIQEGLLSEEQAVHIIRRIKNSSTNEELAVILTDLEMLETEDEGIDLTELLMRAAFVSDKEVQIATPLSLATRTPLVKMLQDANLIDARIIECATLCKALIDARILELEQGIIALVYAIENETSFEETLRLFGWLPSMVAA